MGKEKTRMDVEAFTKAFKTYFTRKYSSAHSDKDMNKAVRDFVEEVSNVAGNPQTYGSLMRRYEVLLSEFNTVFNNLNKNYSPTYLKESTGIKDEEYIYTISYVLNNTDIESRTAVRNRAKNKDVDCIEKEMPAGGIKYLFSKKGVHQLTTLINPRPGAQNKNKS